MKTFGRILGTIGCVALALVILIVLSPVWLSALLWMAITKKTPRGL